MEVELSPDERAVLAELIWGVLESAYRCGEEDSPEYEKYWTLLNKLSPPEHPV